ncbi:MAG: DUF4258 domain-containing protein [Epsilonproteobacteria bacterium]|nr:DUF4258 domain-containing protein [Campylobacterota bacterium]
MFEWSEEKNLLLEKNRGISFEEIVEAISQGDVVADEPHFDSKNYPNHGIFFVEANNYIYCVPYKEENSKIFLKTIYPSIKATKKFLKDKVE